MESHIEQTLVAAIDDVLTQHSGGGLITRNELVDVLLDLRVTVSELALLASLEQQSTPARPARGPTRWHWPKDPAVEPNHGR
jgi:hypothetical protein